jgi:FMN phosphatase YigB (HAD superfamily)
MNKKIIFDIDSTLTDHWRRIRKFTIPKWPNGTIDSKAFSREEVLKDQITNGLKFFMSSLVSNKYDISYLTARGWPDAKNITIEQLKFLGMPNPEKVIIVSNMIEKVKILKNLKPDIYIDDFMTGQENSIGTFHKEVALSIQTLGINVIVFRNDWADVMEQIIIYEGRNK